MGKVITKVEALIHRPIKLSIEENPLYVDKVGFFIWAEDENLDRIQSTMNRTYFIPRYDFEYVVDIFASVFPIFNPMRKYLETSFDECSDNYFDHAAITEIISKIKVLNVVTDEIGRLLTRLIYVLEEKNEIGKYLVVFGNQYMKLNHKIDIDLKDFILNGKFDFVELGQTQEWLAQNFVVIKLSISNFI